MPYRFEFYPEKHLIYLCYFGNVTLDDAHDGQECLIAKLAEVDSYVHTLMDLRYMQEFPTSIKLLKNVMRPIQSENLHWMILVTNNNRLVKYLGSILMQVLIRGVRLRLLDTMEEALEFLVQQDAAIGDIAALIPEFNQSPN